MATNFASPQLPNPQPQQVAYSLRADLTWSMVSSLLDFMLALKVSGFASPRHLALCWVIPLQNLAVAWCILRQPGAYTRHRTGILAVPKLLRMVTVGVALREYVGHAAMALPGPGDGWLGVAVFLAEKGALQLLIAALSRRLLLRTHVVVQTTALLLVLASNSGHCERECANPGTAALYAQLSGWLNTLLLRALPFNVASRKDTPPAHGCMLVTSWLQVVFGMVAPTLYIDYIDERLRWRRGADADGDDDPEQDWLAPQPVAAALVHLALFLGSLPVAWRAALAVDWWLRG